jgi:hypothetical protein
MPMRMRLFVCFMICIQEHGGGIHRYIALTTSTTHDTNDTLEKNQSAQPRRHHNSNHHLVQQNSSNLVPQQICLPRLSHHWQHPKRNLTQAIMQCLYTSGIFAMHTPQLYF